jgi:hypothetical protein
VVRARSRGESVHRCAIGAGHASKGRLSCALAGDHRLVPSFRAAIAKVASRRELRFPHKPGRLQHHAVRY